MATPQFEPPSASDDANIPQQHRRNKSTDTATSSIGGMNFNDNQSILTNQSWFGGGGGSVMMHHPSDNQTVTSNATNLFLQFDSHQQLYYCPHHRYAPSSGGDSDQPPQPIYYKYATDSCPHCEQEFKNHTAYLQQRKKDVMEQLDMYASVAGASPSPSNGASPPRHASAIASEDVPPPTTVTMMPNGSNRTAPPPPQQQSVQQLQQAQQPVYAPPSMQHYGGQPPHPSYAQPPTTVVYHAAPPPPPAYHHLHHHHPGVPAPPPVQFATSQQHMTSSSYSTPPQPVVAPSDDVARMRHIQDYIFLEKSKECEEMKQKLQQQTELIQQLKIENALLTEKLVQQEMRMQQELKFLKLAASKKAAKSNHASGPPQRSLVLVPTEPRNGRKNRLDQYQPHARHLAAVPPRPPNDAAYGGGDHHNNPVVSPLSSPVPYAPQFADERPNDDDRGTYPATMEESYSAGEPPPPHWKLEPSHVVHGDGSQRLPRPMMDYFDDDIQDDYHKDEDDEEEDEDEETTNKNRGKTDPAAPASAPLVDALNHLNISENGVQHSTIPKHFEVDDQAPPVVPLEETISVATFLPPPPNIQRSNDWTEVAATNAEGWGPTQPNNPSSSESTAHPTAPATTTTTNRPPPPTTAKLAPPSASKLPPKSSNSSSIPTQQQRSPPRTTEIHMPPSKDVSAVSEDEMDAWSYVAAVDEVGGNKDAHRSPPSQPTMVSKITTVGVGVNAAKEPASKGVTWTDDAASLGGGQSVASSTFGEDRHHVTNQEILDPYGDRGTYSGIILRSTGMPHGSGIMMYQEDHRTYDGEWRHGRWHGHGKATFANGDSYLGEYRFDQRHGRGRYEWNDGRVYDGMFREDKRHGRGNFIWPDGAAYEGEFRNGQREGQGTYQFSDGGKYEGSWRDGRYSGFGICSWEDGRCYKGEWMNGMAHGRGVETFPDGSVRHDGMWVEDEPVTNTPTSQ